MVLFKLVFQRVVHALVYRDILPPLKLEDAVSEVYLAIVQVFARYVDAVDVCVRAGRVRQVGLDGRAAFAHPQLVDYAELGARATVHGTYDGLLRPFGGVVFLCLADLFGRVTVYFFHVPVVYRHVSFDEVVLFRCVDLYGAHEGHLDGSREDLLEFFDDFDRFYRVHLKSVRELDVVYVFAQFGTRHLQYRDLSVFLQRLGRSQELFELEETFFHLWKFVHASEFFFQIPVQGYYIYHLFVTL